MLCGVYQDWVHQNPGDHLDGGLSEYSKWQAKWEKLIFMTNQRYDAPCGKVGKRFVVILSVELDRVRDRRWNAERAIVFNPLSYNSHKALIILHKFESAYFSESISGTMGSLDSS